MMTFMMTTMILTQTKDGGILQEGKKAKLEKLELPLKIKLVSDPWTPESGLVTAALKLKREVIKKTYAEDLHHLYSS